MVVVTRTVDVTVSSSMTTVLVEVRVLVRSMVEVLNEVMVELSLAVEFLSPTTDVVFLSSPLVTFVRPLKPKLVPLKTA